MKKNKLPKLNNLVNGKGIVRKAFDEGYAVPHININNLEWANVVLKTAEQQRSPIIIGTSEGAVKYMGGFNTVYNMVTGLMYDLGITIPVVLHLDHGSYEGCLKALEAGYTSVMYDGSHEEFDVNLENTKKIIKIAKKYGASVEAEVGSIGGEEDGIVGVGEIADPEQAKKMASAGVDFLAAGIGNIHGPYPSAWKSLKFEALTNLAETCKIGIVLHGGSGIPRLQIEKAIALGVAKININTELQQSNAKAIKNFVISGEIDKGKNFDPRKLLGVGSKAMAETVLEKINELGSKDKA